MSSDTVWMSEAPSHASNLRPVRHDIAECDKAHSLRITPKIENGEPFDDQDFPTTIWYTKPRYLGLPNFFYAFGFWILSDAAAEAIASCGLGQGELRPVTITRVDRKTPIDGKWLCWSPGNAKQVLVPEESLNIMEMGEGWVPPFVTKDDDIAVTSSALEGEPIWVDPQMHSAFFMAGRVVKALKQAKATRGFMLKRCRVLA